MGAIKLTTFGGMVPAVDDALLPDGAASLSRNAWLYTGKAMGFKAPSLVRALVSSTAQRVFRIPNDPLEKTNFANSVWMEFQDHTVRVIRAPMLQDSYSRYYWLGEDTGPLYNPLSRIQSGSAPYRLGVPAPAVAPGVTAPVEPPDVTAPVPSAAEANGRVVTITFTEERRLSSTNAPPISAFRVKGGSDFLRLQTLLIDEDNLQVVIGLAESISPGQAVTVYYTKPSSTDLEFALQDNSGNETASFEIAATNNTPDTEGPQFLRATVDGDTLVITFREYGTLQTTNLPYASRFTVESAGRRIAVTNVAAHATDKTITLTLAEPVEKGKTTKISYADPTYADDARAIQDQYGNDAPSFTDRRVSNATQDSVPAKITGASVSGDKLVLSFTKALDASMTPVASRFSVTVNFVAASVDSVSVNGTGKTVTLQLSSAVMFGAIVYVTYADRSDGSPTAGYIKSANGYEVKSFSTFPVSNNTSYPSP